MAQWCCLHAHCAIELYATVFECQNALDKLEGFASKFGADFYNLPHNTQVITLKKQDCSGLFCRAISINTAKTP
jgi:dihydroorotase